MSITVRARGLVQRHPVLSYVVLAYALAWSWYLPLAMRGTSCARVSAAHAPTGAGSAHAGGRLSLPGRDAPGSGRLR